MTLIAAEQINTFSLHHHHLPCLAVTDFDKVSYILDAIKKTVGNSNAAHRRWMV